MIQFEGIPEINGFCIFFFFFWIFFFFFATGSTTFVEPYLLISGFLDKLL